MIRYALKCRDGHGFDSWFQSAEAFDALKAAGHLSCPDCGGGEVDKAMMTPRVAAARKEANLPAADPAPAPAAQAAPGPLTTPASPREAALAELRRRVEENSDYVGLNFATEVRAMHDGDAPMRAVYGEAALEDARALLEDGIPVAPLPIAPRAKTN